MDLKNKDSIKGFMLGFCVAMFAVLVLYLLSPKYQISTGPKGTYMVNTKTGNVYLRVDLPKGWIDLGNFKSDIVKKK